MKIQWDTLEYNIEDALVELKKVLKLARNKTLEEGDIFPLMQHALEILSFAFNARFLNREVISKMSQEEWEKYLVPPKEIFGDQRKTIKEMRKIRYDTVKFYMEAAFVELRKILRGCKKKTLTEEEIYSLMVQAIKMLNCAFNARYVDRKELEQMSKREFEKYLLPPKKIFE